MQLSAKFISAFLASAASSLINAAQALEPLPPCHGEPVEGWASAGMTQEANKFVTYETENASGTVFRLYLEHCPSGRIMRAEFPNDWSLPYEHPRHPDTIYVFFERQLTSSKPVTQKQLAHQLRERGGKTKLWQSTSESCVCHELFAQERGSKTVYMPK